MMLMSNFDILKQRSPALANQSAHREAVPLMLLSNFDISKQRSPALATQSEHRGPAPLMLVPIFGKVTTVPHFYQFMDQSPGTERDT